MKKQSFNKKKSFNRNCILILILQKNMNLINSNMIYGIYSEKLKKQH